MGLARLSAERYAKTGAILSALWVFTWIILLLKMSVHTVWDKRFKGELL